MNSPLFIGLSFRNGKQFSMLCATSKLFIFYALMVPHLVVRMV